MPAKDTAPKRNAVQAEHSHYLGRRHRLVQRQRLQPRHHGLPDPQHRPDRREGAMFTDWYGQQSCTAGRAAFITGQSPIRTGLTKVGLPGRRLGLQPEDPTIADVLKPLGYITGQFGKNHLGDRDEFLPTAHGFDEFFGNLYHLNAEEEPENPGLPEGPGVQEEVRPARRAALLGQPGRHAEDRRHRSADEEAHGDGRRGVPGGQPSSSSSPRGRQAVLRLVELNPHAHLDAPEGRVEGRTGLGSIPMAWWSTTATSEAARKLDELGITDNTIVMYSTDNGAEVMSWPDGGTTPFRGEKDTNWEGGWRVPCAIRWPGVIKPGTVSNEIFSHNDMLPTLPAAAGEPDIVEKLKKGCKSGNKTFKVHIDGYNLLPFLKGEVKENPRKGFLYWSDDGDLMALRYEDWKVDFMEQRAQGWTSGRNRSCPCVCPKILQPARRSVRAGDEDGDALLRQVDGGPRVPAGPGAGDRRPVPRDFEEFPPRQKPASFSIDQALEKARQQERRWPLREAVRRDRRSVSWCFFVSSCPRSLCSPLRLRSVRSRTKRGLRLSN